MRRFVLYGVLIFFIINECVQSANASTVKCKQEAESVAIVESKKKGNLPNELLSVAHPTEMDGDDDVVYIGARAYYNYFKLKFDPQCRLIEIEDVEYPG